MPAVISQSAMPSSTPSSPTECGQVETVAPTPLIPIDSLDEVHPASLDDDHDDDESDRLSIVDMNENVASDSLAGTPKPSGVESPLAIQESTYMASSSTSGARNIDSSESISTAISTIEAVAETVDLPSEREPAGADDRAAVVSNDATMDTTQSPQSTVPTSNLV